MRLCIFYFVVVGEGSILADEVGNSESFIGGFFATANLARGLALGAAGHGRWCCLGFDGDLG